eukprot:scaffold110573_cov48-Phaeocystis_antarctica.AAC.2
MRARRTARRWGRHHRNSLRPGAGRRKVSPPKRRRSGETLALSPEQRVKVLEDCAGRPSHVAAERQPDPRNVSQRAEAAYHALKVARGVQPDEEPSPVEVARRLDRLLRLLEHGGLRELGEQ